MVRPEFAGVTMGERLMRWVFSVDKPANCFPSLHVIFAVLGALLIDRAGVGRGVRWFWWAFAVAVSVTTVTSGQHYFIDVPGGVAVALAGYFVGRRLVPTARPRVVESAWSITIRGDSIPLQSLPDRRGSLQGIGLLEACDW